MFTDSGNNGRFMDMFKMNTIMNLRTGDAFIDMIISTIVAGIISIAVSQGHKLLDNQILLHFFSNIKQRFRNRVIIEGKRTFRSSSWNTSFKNIWSLRFDALWDFINNELQYSGVKCLREIQCSHTNYDDESNDKELPVSDNIFIVDQDSVSFRLLKDRDIYCTVYIEDNNGDSDKMIEICGKVETIRLEIHSYTIPVHELTKVVDEITRTYIEKQEDKRRDKVFIYALHGNIDMNTNNHGDSEDNICTVWMERPFRSTRKFENLYFTGKDALIRKIEFFENNREWYEKEGHPYTLGIGLSGPPGTGKTSIIKSIANHFKQKKRHLIQIPLNRITSEEDFYKYYFESTYNRNNKHGSIDFSKKIIVLEDLDCMSDLILDRQHKTTESTETKSSSKNEDFHMFENLVNVVSTVKDGKSSQNNYFSTKENKLTLSFILNILDGLDENDGRILIVTSNYFDQIDKALVRPGRIDIKLEMTNATIETINELYNHYYHEDIPEEYKSRINDYVMSPAEIVNIYRTTETSTEFLNVLIEKCSKELMNTSNSNM
jgi:hypothetical protein